MPLHALRQVIDLKYYNHLKYCGTQYQITDVHLDNIETITGFPKYNVITMFTTYLLYRIQGFVTATSRCYTSNGHSPF